jgi:hypothetical protein
MEVRSYRRVFDLERRVYSIDRLRLNPSGVPLRGIAYFAATLCASLFAARLPVMGIAVRVLPWYLRDLLMPALAAALMGVIRVEGRTFHHAAFALIRFGLRSRGLIGGHRSPQRRRWYPTDVLVLPDGSDHRMRGLGYTGPGAVRVSVEHRRGGRALEQGQRGWVRPGPGAEVLLYGEATGASPRRPEVISLGAGVKLRVHGEPPRAA